MEIKVTKTQAPKQKPNEGKLGFGNYFTDHMFVMPFNRALGWHDPEIKPYGPIELDPAAMILHYAQEDFEGLKAYRRADGEIQLFRPWENFKRLNRSNERLCIPKIDEELALEALKKLVKLDEDWVPHAEGTSLYIRPFIFATDPHLGVKVGDEYLFMIILSPVGAYYPEGLNPVKIYVEKNYVRAVKGGTGMAKVGGNYAASLKAQEEAKEQHFTQVLWLDGVEKKYIEEVGTMNVFFKIDGKIVTPSLEGSILPGITRMSSIEIIKSWGMPIEERRIAVSELADAYRAGKLEEAFGTGTAAVISPIGLLKWGDEEMVIGGGKIGEVSQKLYDTMTGIQWGTLPDTFGWTTTL